MSGAATSRGVDTARNGPYQRVGYPRGRADSPVDDKSPRIRGLLSFSVPDGYSVERVMQDGEERDRGEVLLWAGTPTPHFPSGLVDCGCKGLNESMSVPEQNDSMKCRASNPPHGERAIVMRGDVDPEKRSAKITCLCGWEYEIFTGEDLAHRVRYALDVHVLLEAEGVKL